MTEIKINMINFNGSKKLSISDICGICHENILDKCHNCNTLDNNCYSVIGECNHAYHYCCITNWVSKQSTSKCPMCNQKWELKRRTKY